MSSAGERFRQALAAGPTPIPGACSPLVGKLIEQTGFMAAYLSGAAFSAGQLALPDIGLFTLTELVEETRRLTRATTLPVLVDADTGFGAALSTARTVSELAAAGAAAVQLEDQEHPKRCGHLSGKSLISVEAMCTKLRAATAAKLDPNLVIVARTDARGVEGLDGAILRARAYVAAGADMIFPEALESREEFAAFRRAIDVPLIANMTEFGRSPLLSCDDFRTLGYQGVLYPVGTLRVAMRAIETFLKRLHAEGTQAGQLDTLMTRTELYELLNYQDYEQRDRTYFGTPPQE